MCSVCDSHVTIILPTSTDLTGLEKKTVDSQLRAREEFLTSTYHQVREGGRKGRGRGRREGGREGVFSFSLSFCRLQ